MRGCAWWVASIGFDRNLQRSKTCILATKRGKGVVGWVVVGGGGGGGGGVEKEGKV